LHVSLTVPELWLFEVAIGRNANFQILGAKGGKFQFSLTKPYKECACHQNASFKPLMAIIDPTGGPVAMSMKLKKTKKRKKKIDAWRWQFHACADTPLWTDWSKFLLVGWGHRGHNDVITVNCALEEHLLTYLLNQLCKIFWKSVQGFRSWKTWKMALPSESVHRPYNSAALPRTLWQKVDKINTINKFKDYVRVSSLRTNTSSN